MSVANSTTKSKASKSTKAKELASLPKSESASWSKYFSESEQTPEKMSDIAHRSATAVGVLRLHPLEDIAERMWGCTVPEDAKFYACPDGRTIKYKIENKNYTVGVLPDDYKCFSLLIGSEFDNIWVGKTEDIRKLRELEERFFEAREAVDNFITGRMEV